MIVQKVESMVQADVECIHPDKSSRYYTYSIGFGTFDAFAPIEEEIEQHRDIRDIIEIEVNPTDYWHEIKITLVWYLPNKDGSYEKIEKEI